MNVYNQTQNNNIVYIGIENPVLYSKYPPVFTVYQTITNDNRDPFSKRSFYGSWSETLGEFQIPFQLPSNLVPREIQYDISITGNTISNELLKGILPPSAVPSSILKVESQFFSEFPPLVTNIEKSSLSVNVPMLYNFGYTFTIQSDNGFSDGFIIVTSQVNIRGIEIALTQISGDEFWGNFTATIYINHTATLTNCISQSFEIQYMLLRDKNGMASEYKKRGFNDRVNSLHLIKTEISDLISLNCPAVSSSNITLVYFGQEQNITAIDVSIDNSLSFILQLTSDSGLSLYNLPTLYLMEVGLGMINSTFEITTPVVPNQFYTALSYKTTITVPVGFGLNGGITLSIYGAENVLHTNAGWATNNLNDIGMFYYIQTYKNDIPQTPLLEEQKNNYTSDGGILMVYGNNLGLPGDNVIAQISYPGTNTWINIKIVQNYFRLLHLVIFNIKNNYTTFNLRVKVNNDISNLLEIHYTNSPPSTTKPPDSTNTPVNVCPGSPKCGGEANGICTTTGCQCKPPWVGKECLSQPISIEPNISITEPVVQNTLDTPSGSQIKNLISVQSLIEYNFKGEIIQNITLSNWKFYNLTDSSKKLYRYSNRVNLNTSMPTDFNISIQYFSEDTTLNFANELVDIRAYTLKYTIEMSPYLFKSVTNNLQIVMSALIESSNLNSCSTIESGDTLDTNFQFFKLQVEDHSLYAKFIKKAEIDYRVRSIENVQLSTNSQGSSRAQTLIGINVPYYTNYVLMDPDFSLLLDSRSTADNEDSQCYSPPSKSKLSKEQLIGIIVGSVVGGAIIIAIISYVVITKTSLGYKRSIVRMKSFITR
ncbi:EGF-like domain-containing protein [Tieghemostelium lacteum]|uniref:EGF-like domain-containing protein n=1 Tax=Tieghemostelium lacteum TaxID=361077 RepID=A0A151ZRJ9_TIELA|nr:EGF-like domain-containing protein [Tieghemostelium lacteum]|eukprot:KYQ96651.1 EGF-like domain-containing protein [Tieghemostelium lacteum]